MSLNRGNIVTLKDHLWLKRQKVAGRAVSACLSDFAKSLKDKSITNCSEIVDSCSLILKSFDCEPTFLNYSIDPSKPSFPAKVCISINKEVVHGIPKNSYEFKEGDIVSLDLGATYQGAIADAAFTAPFGKVSEKVGDMLVSCQDALNAAVEKVSVGNHLGEIGAAIHGSVKKKPFGLITMFGGHGLDYNKAHAPPFVENKARKSEGLIMEAGLSIAIEPMLVLTKNINTRLLKDNWTIVTKDLSCHFEHSVTLDPDGNRHIITEHMMDVKDFLN